MPNLEPVPNIPGADRLIDSLRSSGYAFHVAAADLIDNSIVAKAGVVKVSVEMELDGQVRFAVGDDGRGMAEADLIEAMRYGSRPHPDPASLSKFGLGLKTASTAFCRRLSLISRASPSAPWRKAVWDLDHVADCKTWELLVGSPTDEEEAKASALCGETGSLVLWDKIDRLQKRYSHPGGRAQKQDLDRRTDTLRHHLGMVFQRFLDPAYDQAPELVIELNGQPVAPWDPFCAGTSTKVSQGSLQLDSEDGKETSISVTGYVLPRREDFEDEAAAQHARLKNEYQGIYIYRENRLIDGPHYMGRFVQEPHWTLCRVELSFDHLADDAMGITFQKNHVDPWPEVRDRVMEAVGPARRAAAERYRKGQRDRTADPNIHRASNTAIGKKAESLRNARLERDPSGKTALHNRSATTGTDELRIQVERLNDVGGVHVRQVPELTDGLLWKPLMLDDDGSGKQAVLLNMAHDYYRKVYLPHREEPAVVQKLDLLIWALGTAELGTISKDSARHFEELRFELSRLLRRLVEDMPEPDEDEMNRQDTEEEDVSAA